MITQKQLYKLPGQISGGKMRVYFVGTSAQRDAVPENHWDVEDGDFWFNTANNKLYVYISGVWTLLSTAGELGSREAFASEDAGDDAIIDATLDSLTGTAISVTCTICGGVALNSAYPRLADETRLMVYWDGTVWRAYQIFQTSEICD